MNSWDCWDTLIARRYMRDELYWQVHREGKTVAVARQFELDNLIPIQENISKVKPEDIIISDYGDGTPFWLDFLKDGLGKFGLHNRIYLTPGEKWAKTIWAKLDQRPAHHFGDNQAADVDSPLSVGIPATLTVTSPFTAQEKFLEDLGMLTLARICRETRLRTNSNHSISLMQANYNFPVLVAASVMLNRRCPKSKLLMSGRDCYMWVRLMQQMYGRGEYWHTSCKMRMNATENFHRYIKSFGDDIVLVDLCGSGNSFSYLSMYPTLLMFTPEASQWHCPALWRGPDVWRLEQANRAPHAKCVAINDKLEPEFLDSGIDCSTEPNIKEQCRTFAIAMEAMTHYDISEILNASDQKCLSILQNMLPQYLKFADVVEPLRQIDVHEDSL